MVSLVQMTAGLKQRRLDAAKRRKRNARSGHTLLMRKRSSLGQNSMGRKMENTREELTDVSGVLTLKQAQKESLNRLISTAEDRLSSQHEAKEQTVQEFEFAGSEEEKQIALSRLRTITERIEELGHEIGERTKMLKKITNSINNVESEKSKISSRLAKQSKTSKKKAKSSRKISKVKPKKAKSSRKISKVKPKKAKSSRKISKVKPKKAKSSRKISKVKPKKAKSSRKISKVKPKKAKSSRKISKVKPKKSTKVSKTRKTSKSKKQKRK